MAMLSLLVTHVAAALSPSSPPVAADFLITSLPGLATPPTFKHYSGFMPLGDADGTHLFFWFVESQSSPADDPIVYWTNGGPGSSSVAYGFWTEHGPWRLAENGTKVVPYEYSWNKRANVVYVEQPSGVGLSWSANEAHYATNDEQAAGDNLLFLKAFFNVFPEFKTNGLYLTGESYGGHYVPQLSHKVLLDPAFSKDVNMKGFWIGNPGINSDWYYNVNEYAFLTFMWGHALLPQVAYTKASNACGWGTFLDISSCGVDFTKPSLACVAATHEAWKYLPSTWDPYDVLAPTCHDAESDSTAGDAFVAMTTPHMAALRAFHNRGAGSSAPIAYDPCIKNQTPLYMKRADVLAALHAESHPNPKWPGDRPGWKYGDEKEDVALLFPDFFANASEWKIAVVSGTADAAVPFVGTQRWLECLGRPVKTDWKDWFLNSDVAGAIKQFDRIDFVTVKGCGHTIPTYCPEAGFAILDNWLNDTWPATSKGQVWNSSRAGGARRRRGREL